MATMTKVVTAGPSKDSLFDEALFNGELVEFTMQGVGKRKTRISSASRMLKHVLRIEGYIEDRQHRLQFQLSFSGTYNPISRHGTFQFESLCTECKMSELSEELRCLACERSEKEIFEAHEAQLAANEGRFYYPPGRM